MWQEYFVSLISDWLVIVTSVVIVCLFAAFRYVTRNNDYFSKRNVPYLKPTLLVGNFGPFLLKKLPLSELVNKMYRELDGHRVGGTFHFLTPMYLVRDPELIKHVTVKDFEHFVDLPIIMPDDTEPILTKNLQALKGQKWKDMRSILSPAFTSSKMKVILVLITEICQQLTTYLKTELDKHKTSSEGKSDEDPADVLPLDVKDLFTKFTNDVIATSAFGIKCNTLQNPNNDFYKMGKDFLKVSVVRVIIVVLYGVVPKFMKLLRINVIPKRISNFFRSLVRDSIQMREREGIVRPDMIHLLMQVRDESMFEDKSTSSETSESVKSKKISLGIDDIAAQALVFFSAGFEVVALLLSFASILFVEHQDIQQRVREEIDEVLAQHQDEISYDAIQKMKLLDSFISETLRMYPLAPAISRKCVKDYQIPESNHVIDKGTGIVIPVHGLHHDPKYFPDPEVFNPDRFSESNKHNINQFTYMPFGSGPRQCIANRFALMETKAALVCLLKHFELHTTSKTKLPIRIAKSLQMSIEGGFWVGFKLRSNTQ